MGIFDFLKKKESIQAPPSPQDFDLSQLNTDLPPLTGLDSTMDLNTNNAPVPQGQQLMMPQTPQQPFTAPTSGAPSLLNQTSQSNSQLNSQLNPQPIGGNTPAKSSLTINMPSLDFSMPASDDHESITEDLNKLFLSDPKWKEPDWNTFDPYPEPEIEHPTSNDFGVTPASTDLPEFSDVADQPEQFRERVQSAIPIDVFVKGTDYSRVFSELTRITEILKTIDPKIEQTNNEFSKEEILLRDSKEDMEYIYKKLIYIDKRIFNDI